MPEVLYVVTIVAILYGFIAGTRYKEVKRQRDFALAQLADERSRVHSQEMRQRQARDSRGRFLGLIEGERR